jgi:hypothetical protein
LERKDAEAHPTSASIISRRGAALPQDCFPVLAHQKLHKPPLLLSSPTASKSLTEKGLSDFSQL